MRDDWRTDMENAPRDGSDVLFPIAFIVRAYWDANLEQWITNRTITIEHVVKPTRFRLPDADTSQNSGEK